MNKNLGFSDFQVDDVKAELNFHESNLIFIHFKFSGLQASLPPAVHLLTLSQWDEESVLLRLEHQFQSWESKSRSQPVTVNLQVRYSKLLTSLQQEIYY